MTWNIYFLNEKWYCDVYTFYFYKVLIDSENIFLEELDETNKTDCHDIAEILLKVALNTIN
jgi:hypothetical protein